MESDTILSIDTGLGDITYVGSDASLDKVQGFMQKSFLCKIEGRMGRGAGDLHQARILNRIVAWDKGGII